MTAFRSRNASKSAAQDFQPKSSQSGVVFRFLMGQLNPTSMFRRIGDSLDREIWRWFDFAIFSHIFCTARLRFISCRSNFPSLPCQSSPRLFFLGESLHTHADTHTTNTRSA